MTILKQLVAILIMSTSITTFANLHIPQQSFEGSVSKFNNKFVKVLYKGEMWTVPRSKIKNAKSLKIGSLVEVFLEKDDLGKIKVTKPKVAKRKRK